MDDVINPILVYFLQNLDLLLWRDYLQELLTIPDRIVAVWNEISNCHEVYTTTPMYVGKLIQVDNELMRVDQFSKISLNVYQVDLSSTGIQPIADTPLVKPTDKLQINTNDVANYTEAETITTTVGRVILNHLILAVPFGNKISYINKLWNPDSLENMIGDLIIRQLVSVDQVNTYIKNTYFIGHAPELIVPNLSEKALTTDPNVDKRKQELLLQYKTELANNDAIAMNKIENELVAMDKAWLAGDSSMGYYIKSSSFSIHRKKLLLTHGMVEAFGDTGHYDFIANSLEQGWTPDDFAKISNEIRSGSYARAKETAKGGEESKFLARVFQSSRVTESDCKTDKTLDILFREDNAADYVYRNHITENKEVVVLTKDTTKELIGKIVHIRSPLFCQTPDGYCFCCMGQTFDTLQQNSLATAATAIGAQMSISALKKMHGVSVSTVEIRSLNEYVV